MALPRATKHYFVDSICPECGEQGIDVWESVRVGGDPNRLARRCLCRSCGCWFQEELTPRLTIAVITKQEQDGKTTKSTSTKHLDACPSCGKPLEEGDPYLMPTEQAEDEKARDIESGISRRDLYCLDCHIDLAEEYRLERSGTSILQHGAGREGTDCCPLCGSDMAKRVVERQDGAQCEMVCQCIGCGSKYRVRTEEICCYTTVEPDRDNADYLLPYETLFEGRLVHAGDKCPLCEAASLQGEPDAISAPQKWVRALRLVAYDCPNCWTRYYEHIATRVVSNKLIR